jgi:hypothetical protein
VINCKIPMDIRMRQLSSFIELFRTTQFSIYLPNRRSFEAMLRDIPFRQYGMSGWELERKFNVYRQYKLLIQCMFAEWMRNQVHVFIVMYGGDEILGTAAHHRWYTEIKVKGGNGIRTITPTNTFTHLHIHIYINAHMPYALTILTCIHTCYMPHAIFYIPYAHILYAYIPYVHILYAICLCLYAMCLYA